MVKYIVKRVLYSALILLIVSMLLYLLIRLLPMDYVENKFLSQANQGSISKEELYRIKSLYGLEDSSFAGICRGYWKWLTAVFHGDLGTSFKYNKPVTEAISDHMWISFGIALAAFCSTSLRSRSASRRQPISTAQWTTRPPFLR